MNYIFYIYAYIDVETGKPYYIGKGKNNRAWYKYKREKIPIPKNRNNIILLETNLSEIGALALERRLITWWGRKNNGTGCLINRTNGGEGFSGMILGKKGPMSEERKRKISYANKGKKKTEEHKKKISITLTGKPSPKSKYTKTENYKPSIPKGTKLSEDRIELLRQYNTGLKNGNCRMTTETLNDIRRDIRNNIRDKDIAIKYGFTSAHISHIRRGIAYPTDFKL